MLKWLVTVLVVLVVFVGARAALRRLAPAGRLLVPVRGRIYYIPLASTLVFSLLVWLISKVL